MLTKSLLAAAAVAFTSVSALAFDGAIDYSADEFNAAKEAGGHVVVDVYKKGCPTCAKQAPTLVKASEMYPDATFFRVNIKDRAAKKVFEAVRQSTIIVYNDGEEIDRTIGVTNESKLLASIAKGADTPEAAY